MLQQGQRVRIHRNPNTGEGFEGLATLIEQYREDTGDGFSMWVVKFDHDKSAYCLRTINEANQRNVNEMLNDFVALNDTHEGFLLGRWSN